MLQIIDKDIIALQKGLEHPDFKRNRFPKYCENRHLFNLSIKDIILSHKQLLITKDNNERNLAARLLALHLFEFLKDFKNQTGKEFRKELLTIPNSKNLIVRFDSLKNGFNKTKDMFWDELEKIRNESIGHKTKDVKVLFKTIESIDPFDIEKAFYMVILIFTLYDKFQKEIVLHFVRHESEISKMPYLN